MSVSQASAQGNWDLHIGQGLTELEEKERDELMQRLNNVTLESQRMDEVTWKWTAQGHYTVKSFYEAMICGPHTQSNIHCI